jgi:type II restriction/modification system DNA methylase subunit YeeA
MGMTPDAFISKWSEVTTLERATVQSHFNDLCRLLGEKEPHEADPTGEWFAFEKGVEKTGAGRGWADAWKRGHFGWEYKSKSGGRESTLERALKQLQQYALALEAPPLLVVSDIDVIEIHTAFQNAVQEVHTIRLKDIGEPENLRKLKWLFSEPERLRPRRTRDQITAEAAGQFAQLASVLRAEGLDPLRVAHFLNRLLFCMFSEDAGLLKAGLFTELAEKGVEHPEHFEVFVKRLFQAMQTGGPFGSEIIDWFNGGLFDSDDTIPLTLGQIRIVRDLARMDWSQIEPAIFGTLFERGLDPDKRSQLGAHYTDPESIMRLVNPTIVEPLLEEWGTVRVEIAGHMERMEKVRTKGATEKRRQAANNAFHGFLERLRNFRVLDPACGSGNFLYLALQAIKDIEHRANIEAEALGLARQAPMVGPEAVMGIELNSYAADLARVTVWIGEIQWMLDHGYSLSRDPILKPLDNIEQRDAILTSDGTEPDWPEADVIIGNPPFLGDKRMISELGEAYVGTLRDCYKGRVPGGADLVTYWFAKAGRCLGDGSVQRVGLVSTNSIRAGANRTVLQSMLNHVRVFSAWSDEPWINEGAAVRVSLVCLCENHVGVSTSLNGESVAGINADLTRRGKDSADLDFTAVRSLSENQETAFIGTQKNGPFDVPAELARKWLRQPNPHGKPNSDVLKPWANGSDVTRRPADKWIIDFGTSMSESAAAKYQLPFDYVVANVKPGREKLRREGHRRYWWRYGETRAGMRAALDGLTRFIATPRVAKHRLFVWLDRSIMPDSRLCVIARDDEVAMGILQSHAHEIWSLKTCSWHGVGNDPTYNAKSVFETFSFPGGLELSRDADAYTNPFADQIAEACSQLMKLRANWLNPPEWTEKVLEVVEGYPDRIIPKSGHEADLKSRTLTNLYNNRPAWLESAHKDLDEAVAAAYGWPADLSDDEILAKLLELNLSREPA